ncbi:MAG: PAS domain S-box protein [Chloroflexi bacterium]|nr:MAG: PAS domain S-box protein [Chloroflexota bacterium]
MSGSGAREQQEEPQPIRVLLVEDSAVDADLLVRELRRAGFQVEWRRVVSQAAVEEALREADWDVVVSDYVLPGFDGLRALATVRAIDEDIPFILISGEVGEEIAVEAMKAGAQDYVLKDKLTRLGPALRRELREAEGRRARRQAEAALRESEARYRALTERLPVGVYRTDIEGRILFANPALAHILGFESVEALMETEPNALSFYVDPEERAHVLERLRRGSGLLKVEQRLRRRDGSEIWVWDIQQAVKDESGEVLYLEGTLEDITDRKRAEEQLRTALREKEVLLRELYHRTKNNMQVILALLSLQAMATDNPEVHEVFQEMENRIKAMALVHQKLYQAQDLSRIDLKEYVEEFAALLFKSYRVAHERVRLHLDVEHLRVPIDIAIPCGLILNELMSNALKYAFPQERPGEICIRARRAENGYIELYFADNGVGIPPEMDLRAHSSLGLQNIFTIAEHQLQGEVRYETGRGLAWHIRFPEELYEQRL